MVYARDALACPASEYHDVLAARSAVDVVVILSYRGFDEYIAIY